MGCSGSKQGRERGPQHLAYEVYSREITKELTVRPRPTQGPFFGKYRCQPCNRHWASRFCWPGKYQICQGCRKPVYPYSHRELCPSDFDNKLEKSKEHKKELCQMCQQRGDLCTKDKKLPNSNYRNQKNMSDFL